MNADKDGPPARDWDKELAQIDKLIAANPAPAPLERRGVAGPGDSGTGKSGPSRGPSGAQATAVGKYARLFTWLRLLLALALGVGMTQWPYVHGCDFALAAYLGGVAVVIIAAFWSLISSWRTRSGLAHFLSVALLFWGAALAAREVLPRIGYAKQAATWRCTVQPPAGAQRSTP